FRSELGPRAEACRERNAPRGAHDAEALEARDPSRTWRAGDGSKGGIGTAPAASSCRCARRRAEPQMARGAPRWYTTRLRGAHRPSGDPAPALGGGRGAAARGVARLRAAAPAARGA